MYIIYRYKPRNSQETDSITKDICFRCAVILATEFSQKCCVWAETAEYAGSEEAMRSFGCESCGDKIFYS